MGRAQFLGKQAKLEIVDQATGGWGHINVDQVMLADAPARSASEAALWFDHGPDYYAAVSWNDIPPADGRRLWLGWMSNSQYGGDVPTSPWRSEMSIPRQVGLRRTVEGFRLVQQPVRELQSLRGEHFQFKGAEVAKANEWFASNHIQGNQLELVVEFEPQSTGVQGVKVLKAGTEETVIGLDREQGTVSVDRTHSGNTGFNPRFPGLFSARLTAGEGPVKLHIFVDACTVEVFVNGGERVFTVLVFPSADSSGVECFGPPNGARIHALDAWKLKSVWR